MIFMSLIYSRKQGSVHDEDQIASPVSVINGTNTKAPGFEPSTLRPRLQKKHDTTHKNAS
jgi:hypothetical protein